MRETGLPSVLRIPQRSCHVGGTGRVDDGSPHFVVAVQGMGTAFNALIWF